MIGLSEKQVEQLERLALVANTPRYLVKHLRGSAAVEQMSALTISDLLDLYAEAKKTHHDAICYAVMVALTTKPYSEMRVALAGLDVANLHWGDSIRRTLEATTPPLDISQVVVRAVPVFGSGPDRPRGGAAQSSEHFAYRPRLIVEP